MNGKRGTYVGVVVLVVALIAAASIFAFSAQSKKLAQIQADTAAANDELNALEIEEDRLELMKEYVYSSMYARQYAKRHYNRLLTNELPFSVNISD